ncbi:hypothetical protein D3C73_688010 [compost metagenome]
MRLGAQQPALAEHTAGTDGGLRLNDVPAGAQRIALRIEERQDPLLLVVVHDEEPHGDGHGHGSREHAEDPAPAQATHEQHERTAGQDQQRGAEVRLPHDQNERHADQHQADADVLELRRQGALGQVPRNGRRHQDLHEFRWLEADHAGNVDPARGTHGVVPHDIHHHQQQHTDHIANRHPARHEARLELGNDDHRHQADAERSGLFGQQVPALATG